ncbi:ankyrin repeat domain-containing protein [Pelosinus sp. IPA-1]|uniref:ankyrin repeat domain-containing protein n=1 Tax=Pelosinus sp. IPA-1 TaxID=3029569 RepID=UPI0024362B4F|nr:ankyrin repeat domain-containing protein [Pelosinus sp. IPA-1]GMB00153.1 hypothetical protein PIPA1_29520 [Pelosinus sp. IPA-1]
MADEEAIDQIDIEELLASAEKELHISEVDLQADSINSPETAPIKEGPLLTNSESTVQSDQSFSNLELLQKYIYQIKIAAILILFCFVIITSGFLGYRASHEAVTANTPLDKIVQLGITFEDKNLVSYAGRGDKEIVTAFLDAGMNINATRNSDGWTALLSASFYKKTDLVHLLLERQAAVNIQDKQGRTSLHYASAMGAEDIVTMLLEAGANPNLQDKQGRTSLMEAYSKQQAKIAEILKNAGADPSIQPIPKVEEKPTLSPVAKTTEKSPATASISTTPEEIRLTVNKVGLIHIGMSLDDLQKIYPNYALREEYFDGEKKTTAIINLPNGSIPSLKLDLTNGKIKLVSTISTYDPRFVTDKNITINSTVGDIQKQYSNTEVRIINNSLFLLVKSMRMLFELDTKNAAIPIKWLETNNPNSISPDTKITRIITY